MTSVQRAKGETKMRLIDADKLEYYQRWEVDEAPTVDAVPVVRCKDCRFYLQSNEKCELVDTRLRFYEIDKTWTGDCFCSWGERKENE